MSELRERIAETLPILIDLIGGSDIRELDVQEGDLRIRLHRARVETEELTSGAVVEPDDETPQAPQVVQVTSPLVGTFYRAGKPGMAPLVAQGSRVDHDTVVGIVEALQVLTEVEAGVGGVVTEVLATDGQPVEYGQALFEVRPGG